MKKVKKSKILFYFVILFFVLLILFLAYHTFINYHSWREHRNYFKNNPQPKIESWMTINMISNRFNITSVEILKEIGINKTQVNRHMALDRLCSEYKQNCIDVVNRLNTIFKK